MVVNGLGMLNGTNRYGVRENQICRHERFGTIERQEKFADSVPFSQFTLEHSPRRLQERLAGRTHENLPSRPAYGRRSRAQVTSAVTTHSYQAAFVSHSLCRDTPETITVNPNIAGPAASPLFSPRRTTIVPNKIVVGTYL